jgi:epoxyqueuosine reductase
VNSPAVKTSASELGFNLCGIARARRLEELARDSGLVDAGLTHYAFLERDPEKRLTVSLCLIARSLVVTGLSYFSRIMQKDPDAPRFRDIHYGTDYHDVIKGKLNTFFLGIKKPTESRE